MSGKSVHIRIMRTDPFMRPSFLRFFLTSNASEPVTIEPTDRRYQTIKVEHHEHTQDLAYFGALRAELKEGGYGKLMHDLMHWKLDEDNVRRLVETKSMGGSRLPVCQKWRTLSPRGPSAQQAHGVP